MDFSDDWRGNMQQIIIVEDEFRIRNGLSTLINKLDMGCKVIGEAENGFE